MRIAESCHALRSLACGVGDLCQLVSRRIRSYGYVAHYNDAVFAILLLVCEDEHGTAHAGNTRGALDNLQCRAQSVASGRQCTGNLSVSPLGLDNHTSQIERILHQFTSLLDGHALALAQFGEQSGILLALWIVERVDECGLVNMRETPLGSQIHYLLWVSDKDEVSEIVGKNLVGSTKCTLLGGFREHDALPVTLGTHANLF